MAQSFETFLSGVGLKGVDDFEQKAKALEAGRVKAMEPFVEKQKSLSAEMRAIGDTIAKRETPKEPELKPLPEAPDSKYQDPMQAMGSMASLLAIVGSVRTRAPLTSALTAAAASMEGFHKGDQQRVTLERTKWKDNLELGLKQNQIETEKYASALKAADYDFNKASAQMRVIAAEHQDTNMLAAIESGNWDRLSQLLDQKTNLGFKIAQLKEQDDLKRAMLATKAAGAHTINPDQRLGEKDLRFLAEQYWQGDTSVFTNLGRGKQAAENIVGLRKMIRKVGEEKGKNPAELAAKIAEFQGFKSGQRTLGTRTANIEMAATEADQLADLALTASGNARRSGIKTLNSAIQAVEKGTADPELRQFVAANTSFINAYARAINPQGVGTVADKEHAREMLDTAFSTGDYEAVIKQLKSEIAAAKASPGIVGREMRDRFTGAANPAPSGGGEWSVVR